MSKGKVSIIKIDKKTEKFSIKRPSLFKRIFFWIRDLFSSKKAATKKEETDKPLMKPVRKLNEANIQKREWLRVAKGTKWKCIRCGWCCKQNWRVNLTWTEYDRLKDDLKVTEVVEDRATGMSHPLFEIKDTCICLAVKNNTCKIHSKRPYACATFPFALDPKGVLIYSKWCKGIGQGPDVDIAKTGKKILKERRRAGMVISSS
jgi:Fe-S-cluster containining protein